jgi:hypothetical protein
VPTGVNAGDDPEQATKLKMASRAKKANANLMTEFFNTFSPVFDDCFYRCADV